MRCPKCRAENPETKKFCTECGAKLSLVCPHCQAEILPTEKFCGECGASLTASVPSPDSVPKPPPSLDRRVAQIQHYLPKELAEKILSQRERIEGERKQVTVLFTDMAGYTSMSEKLDPEEAFGLMEQVYEILIRTVNEYGGTVNELTGDGIMALFGAPIALEDAPQRAIRASLAIHREMVQFNDKMRREKAGLPVLRMRAGINTGPVVVGTLGNDLRVELKVAGDTVNLASRMEGLAEPGSTYCTEDTFKLTEGLFRFEGLGEKAIKGKEKPIRVYRVIAPSTSRTRFDVSAERGLTPFVGRERERELLLDAFERARQGRGQAVSIVSEAGMGKSRLLYEFRKAVLNEDITFLEGKCLSFGRGMAYQPIADILKSNFDIRDGDIDIVVRNKVKQGFKALAVDEGPALPYILELLSVQDSGIEKIAISPEGKKDKISETIKKLILKGAEARPLVLAIEDLHWIDKTSEEAMKYLLESITGARIMLILTYRPEFIPTWGARSYHNQLLLNRLSNRESLFMATHILDTEDLETALEEVILEKTEGIPFFVEEFIKSMKDLGFIERKDHTFRISKELQTIRIPSTIQDIIMARVDSLPEGAKELLQVGSLIEREFSYKLIKAVMHLPEEELLRRLSFLKDTELLYERGLFPESTFVFKHALTREVLNNSILTRIKKRLHDEIGNAIEKLYFNNIDEHYAILSEHFIAGENYKKGIKYSKLAGRKATLTGSVEGAIEYARKTVTTLEKLPQTEDVQKEIIDMRTVLGAKLADLNYFQDAKIAIDPVIDAALKKGYKKRISQIFSILGGREYCIAENFPTAFEYLEKALGIAEELDDNPSLGLASYWLGYARSLNAEFEKAAYHLEKMYNISMLAGDIVRMAIMKSLHSWIIYFVQGKIDDSHRASHEALHLAEESGDIYSNSFAYGCRGISCFGKGFLEEAKTHFLKGVALSEKINQHFWNSTDNHFLGEIYFEIGDYKKARDHYEKSINFMEKLEWLPSWVRLNRIAIIRVEALSNGRDIDVKSLNSQVSENRLKQFEGLMQRYIGEILLSIDDYYISEAEHRIQKAIEADERNRMPWDLARDYALYAELFKKKGDLAQARETLGKAIDLMRGCGADGWVKKYEEELAALS